MIIEGDVALRDIDVRHDDFRILGWAAEPGDIVGFHMLTLLPIVWTAP